MYSLAFSFCTGLSFSFFSVCNITWSEVIILQFHESLVGSLLLGMSFEKLKSGPRQKSTSHSKSKLADHKFEEKEGSARIVQRCCADCYEKIKQQQSREASNATAKKIKTFCSDCDKLFVLIVSTSSSTLCNK